MVVYISFLSELGRGMKSVLSVYMELTVRCRNKFGAFAPLEHAAFETPGGY
jgi:hypothetical protein